jgi:hypothetical protein
VRLAAGAYILDSGLRKWGADEETAKDLQSFASGAYPVLADVEPVAFAKALSVGEVLIGAGLLIPVGARAGGRAGPARLRRRAARAVRPDARHASSADALPHAGGNRARQGRLARRDRSRARGRGPEKAMTAA